MGEGFMGGLHPPPPLRTFLISDFVLQDTEKILCQCYQNDLIHPWLKLFIFQMSVRSFPWHHKGGVHPPINLEVLASDILAIASRLKTLYVLET